MVQDLYPSRHRDRPGLLERCDRVVHAPDFAGGPVPEEKLYRFERNGVIVLENVLRPHEVAHLKRAANALRDRPREMREETVVLEPGRSGAGAVRSIFAIHRQTETFARLAADPRLVDIARFILDDEVYLHQSRINYKPAFRGKEFYWHSDFETWHVEDGMPRMRAISFSVMLNDNHPQAGPTFFIPGSQNTFVQCVGKTPDDHYKSSLRNQEYGVPDATTLGDLADQYGIYDPAPAAGSIVVFDCNTLHASNGNITPWERINAFFVYNAWSNRLVEPFGGTPRRPEFLAHRDVDAPLRSHAYLSA